MAMMAATSTGTSMMPNSPSGKLKIAQLCPYDIHRPGGVQRHIIDLSAALHASGHDVTIIAPRVGSDAAANPANGGSVFPDPRRLSIAYVGNGRLFAINKTQFEITLAFGDQYRNLIAILQNGAFDVIHFHTLLAPFLPMQAFRRSQAANIASFHEVPPDSATGSIQRFFNRSFGRRLMPKLDGIVLASEVQANLHAIGDAGPLAVLPPGTDLRRFHSSATALTRYRDGRINLLFLGRLEPRKGAIVLLKAYLELCRLGLPVRLLIGGDGPQRARLERFVRKHHLFEVVFLGKIADADVPQAYAACDIFCAPSLYAEGFGIVLAEAMASGKPIVAAANAGYRTVLHGEAANFLVQPGDVEAFSGRLQTLIADQALRGRLAEWGRHEARRYDIGMLVPEFVTMYEQAVRRKLRRDERSRAGG
jgi:phosphatidyl-myo-inositol alpha-mannosyltransferase